MRCSGNKREGPPVSQKEEVYGYRGVQEKREHKLPWRPAAAPLHKKKKRNPNHTLTFTYVRTHTEIVRKSGKPTAAFLPPPYPKKK